MPKIIAVIAIASLTIFMNSVMAGGFKGITLEMKESDLPKTLQRKLISYEGQHKGDFFDVTVINQRVAMIDVIYSGETIDNTAFIREISLAQSIKEHSLSKSAFVSFGIAKGRDGKPWGIIDITHRIAYKVAVQISPSSKVESVGYLLASAPVITTAKSNPLDQTLANALLSAAANSAAAAPVVFVPSSTR